MTPYLTGKNEDFVSYDTILFLLFVGVAQTLFSNLKYLNSNSYILTK